MQTRKRAMAAVCVLSMVAAGGTAIWWQAHDKAEQATAKKRLVYQSGGYGGFTKKILSAPSPTTSPTKAPAAVPSSSAKKPMVILTKAQTAYAQGRYKEAEKVAKQIVAQKQPQSLPTVAVASAEHLLAFAAARQGDLKTARERFAQARQDAEQLPTTTPAAKPKLGETPDPTLAQDAAYQHAVCTMALGDKAGAEKEFVQFMRDFPTSPLVHASMRRIARMHGGDIPKDVETVWNAAQDVQRKQQEEQGRLASMCAPDCVAELLRRRGETVSVEALAREMKTDSNGSSLASLQGSLQRHGFRGAQGLRLTPKGLSEQKLPVIALVQPGHFVVVDKIGADGSVTFWDKSQNENATQLHRLAATEWQKYWQGVALTTADPIGGTTKKIEKAGRAASSPVAMSPKREIGETTR